MCWYVGVCRCVCLCLCVLVHVHVCMGVRGGGGYTHGNVCATRLISQQINFGGNRVFFFLGTAFYLA